MARKYTPPPEYVPRMINLERSDYDLVKQYAKDCGLGNRGFSAAVRLIIREWSALKPPSNTRITYPPAPKPPVYQ